MAALLPAEPAVAANLPGQTVIRLARVCGCGFAQAELDTLYQFLADEGVATFDGTLLSRQAPA